MKIEFKSKGGIYIKPKNRGSFRRWCGGNVTEECIRRGKASSNPAIRKRATFAANARKWKHKEGGILKASDGSNTKNWWSKATDWIGNNKDLLQTGFNAFSSIGNIGNASKALNSFDDETQAGLNAINGNIDQYTNMYAPYFQNNNPDVQSSDIDQINKAFTYSKNIINQKKKEYLQNRTQSRQQYQNQYQQSINNFSSQLSDFGLQAFQNFFPKANKTIDLKPVQGVSITPQESLKMNIPTLPSEFNFGNK